MEEELKTTQAKFVEEFNKIASVQGFSAPDNMSSDILLGAANRIFLHETGGKIFSVDVHSRKGRGHEAILDKSGMNYEFESMTVLVPPVGIRVGDIWNLYREWIIVNRPIEYIERMMEDFDDGLYG